MAIGRPHRRERLCELFWDLPDDPRAPLSWSLGKLRPVADGPDRIRILADRERVAFDAEELAVDIRGIHARLRQDADALPVDELEEIAERLGLVRLDGLESAGDEAFLSRLLSKRQDAEAARTAVLRRLATHPAVPAVSAPKWRRLWVDADVQEAARPGEASPEDAGSVVVPLRPAGEAAGRAQGGLRTQRIGFCDAPDGTEIACATIGKGPPLLKAASWLTYLEFDWTSPIWGRRFS